ncbi:hypothetical protein BDFB_015216 [Asbolus verrucosus]|uniref:Uncharacterized protein n=1 Tax=Asbolus verrucosus TaxID=1661398 RepID=A0A482VVM2_ASBVE|nr:hypothetical protein BDFB_015216 [Asbolus verrucosus]
MKITKLILNHTVTYLLVRDQEIVLDQDLLFLRQKFYFSIFYCILK